MSYYPTTNLNIKLAEALGWRGTMLLDGSKPHGISPIVSPFNESIVEQGDVCTIQPIPDYCNDIGEAVRALQSFCKANKVKYELYYLDTPLESCSNLCRIHCVEYLCMSASHTMSMAIVKTFIRFLELKGIQ